MHLTILFSANYPRTPPNNRMDSKVTHPNIKSEDMGHTCASILDTQMGYTSAYTLKGIAIQLSNFYSSDRIQVEDVVNEYNVIRTRELRCFCLKKDFLEAKLGIGVNTSKEEKGNMDWVVSEFDILSDVAFDLELEQITYRSPVYPYEETAKRTLTYASEKAIESYFHVFHLLVCIAREEPEIVKFANELLFSAEEGNVDKRHISNIGHFMIATLLADIDTSARLTQAVITEVITRNTIRVLQQNSELAYGEPTAVSDYRLQKTFDASKTSYRLLMFIHIFRGTALGSEETTVQTPRQRLRAEISQVDSFRDFLAIMDIPGTTKARFTGFLRERMQAAVAKGYVSIPFTQQQAMYLRKEKEPGVEVRPRILFIPAPKPGKDDHRFGRGQRLLVDL
ncbi:hypothetical protein MBM_04966 [Drepanopeziza brunnea f. sp. 'multigermtubi' MB_m1]|uniref:UBC core domain-containing protein n=1 Tax=Marssonina brunnea f. sp. multigermtubi (strain MB_m1) TaxID=1072389 RepID=K1WVJ2_MARBU|nr:uncharacterized protein MBM_04966 [Drepanopeziza brunnea f. sp. 'multigermtubi' MB_m1]EKD16497.1 hypothetical protein MBM_04966 [Drepanopeziza brunnea f. sp. 'multigermtubi' MB_m1]